MSDFREGGSHPPNSMRFSWRSRAPTKTHPNAPPATQSCWLIHSQIAAVSYLLRNHASVSVSDAVGMTPLCDAISVTWLSREKLAYRISCSPTWKFQTSFGNSGFSILRLLASVFVHTSEQKVSAPLYWNGFLLLGERSSSRVALRGKKHVLLFGLSAVARGDYCCHWRPNTTGKYQIQKHYFTALFFNCRNYITINIVLKYLKMLCNVNLIGRQITTLLPRINC